MSKALTDVKTLPGYNGKLNGVIRNRIAFLEGEKGIAQPLQSFFPHLYNKSSETDMSWRKPINAAINAAAFIDHTALKPETTVADIRQLCNEAKQHHFAAVCVNGSRVALCVKELSRNSSIKVAAVIGFPLGAGTARAKAAEASELVELGAKEIDMVLNIGALVEADYRTVYADIKAVNDAVTRAGGILKVILETCLLNQQQIIDACVLSVAAGAAFVKTSTGFNKGGATPEVIDVMLAVVGNEAKVKASGGVRDAAAAQMYIAAGVSRIGTSSGIAIVKGGISKSKY